PGADVCPRRLEILQPCLADRMAARHLIFDPDSRVGPCVCGTQIWSFAQHQDLLDGWSDLMDQHGGTIADKTSTDQPGWSSGGLLIRRAASDTGFGCRHQPVRFAEVNLLRFAVGEHWLGYF